jgi:hypothetical protein
MQTTTLKRRQSESSANSQDDLTKPDHGAEIDEDDDDVGPMPMPEMGEVNAPRKKRKGKRKRCHLSIAGSF